MGERPESVELTTLLTIKRQPDTASSSSHCSQRPPLPQRSDSKANQQMRQPAGQTGSAATKATISLRIVKIVLLFMDSDFFFVDLYFLHTCFSSTSYPNLQLFFPSFLFISPSLMWVRSQGCKHIRLNPAAKTSMASTRAAATA